MAEFYEFFAGGGMARLGLGDGWACRFANDFDRMKANAYAANHSADHLVVGDIAAVKVSQLQGEADLAWASFPCQDVSLAGDGAGVGDGTAITRSGTFWPFWRLMQSLAKDGRAPKLICLENVYGLLSSSKGRDFTAIARVLTAEGYRFGALLIDAALFLPQSRPRLFIVAIRHDLAIPREMVEAGPSDEWHPAAMVAAVDALSPEIAERWQWWRLPRPTEKVKPFADILEEKPIYGIKWHTREETDYLISLMSPLNIAKVDAAKASGKRMVGGVYRRTRTEGGKKKQRAEVRFDDVAGCLRTPAGGSSRQTILVVDGGWVRSRLLRPREAARLMGLPEDYELPERYNDAYHVAGDGVVVPVVRHLAAHLLEPLLAAQNFYAERMPATAAE